MLRMFKIAPGDFVEPKGSHQSLSHRKNKKGARSGPFLFGGERGIRTLDTLLTYTHFPGVRLQPLGHLSSVLLLTGKFKKITQPMDFWRRKIKPVRYRKQIDRSLKVFLDMPADLFHSGFAHQLPELLAGNMNQLSVVTGFEKDLGLFKQMFIDQGFDAVGFACGWD